MGWDKFVSRTGELNVVDQQMPLRHSRWYTTIAASIVLHGANLRNRRSTVFLPAVFPSPRENEPFEAFESPLKIMFMFVDHYSKMRRFA